MKSFKIWVFSLFLFFVGSIAAVSAIAQGTWAPVAALAPHSNAGVMLLMTDGTVLVKTGSGGGNGKLWDKLTPDIHGSYINGTWTTIAAMTDDRLYFSSQVLRDGRVYVCGGEYGAGGPNGEFYNPVTNTWTSCPVVGFNVSDANSMLLPDGRVLQAFVGSGTRHTRLWDPATNTYSAGPDCLRTDNEASWLKLPDNSILFIDNYSTTSERYIPATNTWINDASVPVNVYDPYGDEAGGAFLLPDGRGFFIGSSGHNAIYTPSGTTAPGTWTAAADIPGPSGTPDAASAMMTNGKILIAASDLPTSTNHFPSPTSFFEYDYTTNTFATVTAPGGVATLGIPSYYTNMLTLPDGTVLYGQQGSNRYYEYTPGSAPLAAGKPTLSGIYRLDCDTFMATGTLFNGISNGASYGDDWQMDTNYPIFRLTSGTNVYYAKSTNWNSTGVQRGSAPDTAKFSLPVGLPIGSYMAEVVVNGNPSSLFPVNTSMAISPVSAAICEGATTIFSDVWTGGTWSSANAAIASIDPVTGVMTGVASGVTTISYFIGSCFATASVTINAAPSAIVPSGGLNLCSGASTFLSSAPTGGIWTSSASSIAIVGSTSGLATGISAGTTTITYFASGCFAVENVTVNPNPTAAIAPSGATTICPGANVVLNATAGAGYTYQWSVGGSPISGATSATYTAVAAGSYTVKITTVAGCFATSAPLAVTIASAPAATITAGGALAICAGNSVALNANAGTGLTYQWKTGGLAIAGATNILYTASASGGYSVVVTNSAGCSTTSSVTTVTVNPLPAAITGTLSFCSGATSVLSSTSPSGTWASSNIAVATVGAGTGIVTGIGTGGFANITYTLGTGCYTTAAVTVNAASAAPITGPSAVCIGQTINLADGTPSGTWSSSNAAVATVSGSGVVSGVAAGSATISYAVISACGTATVTRVVSVSAATVVAPITGILTICSGSTTILSDATASGVWSSSNTAIATIGSAGLVTGITPGVDTIRYSVTNLSGCISSAVAVFNVFSSLSIVVNTAGSTNFCTGGYVTLSTPTGAAYSYQWKRNGIIITGATAASYNASVGGNYTVVVSLPGGCNANSVPVAVTVSTSPIIVPSVGVTTTAGPVFCNATSAATFTAVPYNGGTVPVYQWLVNGGAMGSGPSFTYTPSAGDIITCAMTSNATCAFPLTVQHRDTVSISPLQTPSVTVTSIPAVVCAGKLITFTAAPVYGGTAPGYRWTRNDTMVSASPSYTYVPNSGDVVKTTMYSNFACRSIDSAVSTGLLMHPLAVVANTVNISVTQAGIVAGTVDTFVAIAPNGGTSPGYQWKLNGSPIAGATNSIYVTTTLNEGDVISCSVSSNKPCATPATATSGGIKVKVIPAGIQHIVSGGSSFTLSPNPNRGRFVIEGILADASEAKAKISITDMVGKTLYSKTIEVNNGVVKAEVALDDVIASGLYLVQIVCGGENIVSKIVIEK